MNVIQLQDMLRGLPDDRLKQELSQPTGTVPQYLVLSEVVRRDKMRDSAAAAPQSTVLQDIIGTPTAPQAMQDTQAYAGGGFVTPAQAMGNSGVRGFAPSQPKQQPQFNFMSGGPQMFTPNTTPPPPAPVTNTNVNVQAPTIPLPKPQFDGGQEDGPNAPSFYEQPNGYADGGIIGLSEGGMAPGMAELIRKEAERLGIDPLDLATVISYETAGTFSPTIAGKAKTKWGTHIGLIQMGDPQREEYGYDPQGDLQGQMSAVGRYLEDRGVKPGMGLLDVYSTINAGAPGLYSRSDEAAGGAPGTVAEKVASQMEGHRAKAASLLGQPDQNQALDQEASATMMNPADRELGILSGGVMPDPKERGIGSLLASIMGRPSVSKDMMSLGSSMVARGQENRAPEAPGLTRGDASLVKSIGSRTPEEILAEYQALRTGYMANGGAVRMAEGGQPPLKPKVRYNAVTGTYVDENGRILTREEALAVTPDQLTTAPLEPEGTFEAPPAQAPALEAPSFAPTAYGFDLLRPFTEPTKKEAGYVPTEAQTKEAAQERGPETRRIPSQSAGAAELVRRARFAAEEAPEESSAFNDYLSYLKERDKQLADMYQQQAEEERRRQEEAGGLPFLLRQLGIGMISSGGNLQQGLRGGLQQAFQAREEQTQAARDRIRELQLKGQMAGIEGAGDIAKLRYEAEVAADKASREGRATQKDYIAQLDDIGRLIADREDTVNDSNGDIATDPLLQQYRAIQRELMQKGGLSGTIGLAPYIYDPAQKGIAPR